MCTKITPILIGDLIDNTRDDQPSSFLNDIYYTHSNHLGSANWITDNTGTPIQYIHYAPYGELLDNHQATGYDERFKFTGKERDKESGYDYFGARFLWSPIGIWLSVDPLADKYIQQSPYLYCNGNPIMLVDPDGSRITIYGEDGTFFAYKPGEKYDGEDEFIKTVCSSLDGMMLTENGSKVVNRLSNSSKEFRYTSRLASGIVNARATVRTPYGASTKMGKTPSFNDIAHESYHCYQIDNEINPHTIESEVDAYLFAEGLNITAVFSPNVNMPYVGYGSLFNLKSQNNSTDAQLYNAAVDRLLNGTHSDHDYRRVVDNFKSLSEANLYGHYNSYDIANRKSALDEMRPLIVK